MVWILSSCVINCLYAFWRNLWASHVQSKGKNNESGTRLEGRGYEEHPWLPAPSSPLLDPAFLALQVNSLPSELVSVQFSCSVVSDSLWLHGLQHTKLACPSPTPRACSDLCAVMPSNHLILCFPLRLLPSIFPSTGSFQWVRSLHQVAKVLEFQLLHQPLQWIFRIYFL